MDVSMTSCSVLLRTFSRRCRSSCVRSGGGHFKEINHMTALVEYTCLPRPPYRQVHVGTEQTTGHGENNVSAEALKSIN